MLKFATQLREIRIVALDLTPVQIHAAVIEFHFARGVYGFQDMKIIKQDCGFRILIHDLIAVLSAGSKPQHTHQNTYRGKTRG